MTSTSIESVPDTAQVPRPGPRAERRPWRVSPLILAFVFIPFAITLLIGIAFYIAGRHTRAQLAPAAAPVLPPNIQPVG